MKYRVNIDTANKTKSSLSSIIDRKDNRLLNKVGAFSSLFALNVSKFKQPILVLKTEEPGSKQVLAFKHDRIESVCYDMINHLINDCIVMGAEPLSVQDLIVCGKMESSIVKRIVAACSLACQAQGCALTGGETTEQPDVVPQGTYILGSNIVGIVEKDRIIDGSKIKAGDVLIGVGSSGLHSNGFTLVRDLLSRNPVLADSNIRGKTFIETALEPHRCYYQSLKGLFKKDILKGLAHITGGGVKENLNRILPSGVDAQINIGVYQIHAIFKAIKAESKLSDMEMLRTFNMGVGLVAVCAKENAAQVLSDLTSAGENAYEIGQIIKGTGLVQCTGNLAF